MTTFNRSIRNPLVGLSSRGAIVDPIATVRVWSARWIQRRRLAELTETQLRDIGVSAGAARRETIKPFWQA